MMTSLQRGGIKICLTQQLEIIQVKYFLSKFPLLLFCYACVISMRESNANMYTFNG